jgi:hypothetical protein
MSDLETKPGSDNASGSRNEYQGVQKQLNILLIAVVILSGTLAMFLWRQTRYLRRDLEGLKPLAGPVIQRYNQEKPTVDAFVAKVAEYARSHPDFAPIAKKYQLQNVTNVPSATSPIAPAANKTAPVSAPATATKK